MKNPIPRLLTFFTALLIIQSNINAQTGTWTALTNTAPHNNMGAMLLLTDGTVICHNTNGGGYGTGWDKLTPNSNGSYANGTWTSIASMNHDRLFFASQVLPSGKVFVAGGEYGAGDTAGEVYNPVTNVWSKTEGVVSKQNIYDGNSEILSNGSVLVGVQAGLHPSFDNLYYNPTTNLWSTAPINVSPYNHDEAEWLKLPDNSILFVGIASTASCRFIQSTSTWVVDGTVPVNLYDTYGSEAGAAFMLPNGKAIFFGATPHNALYTPTGTSSPGTWVAAPDFPTIGGKQVGMVDAAAAMMVNGHIICAVSPIGTGPNDEFRTPTYFVEYNYLTNSFTQVTSIIPGFAADSIAGLSCYQTNFLDLPDGTVLFSFDQTNLSKDYWIYTPGSAAIAAGKPTINSIIPGTCPSYKLTGKVFNGISEGAAYGDDWQLASNYPIVRLTSLTSTYYAKTTFWNRIGAVQTDSLEDTVTFTPPATLPAGTYSLVVVANGFASNPTIFKTFGASITSTTNVACHGGTGSLTVTATGVVAPYTYSWAPSGGTNATATNITAGTYTVTVTNGSGCTTTVSATITQPAAALAANATITANVSCNGNNNGSAQSAPSGGTNPYTYSWSNSATTSAISALTAGTYTLTVTDNHGCTATGSVTVTQPVATILVNATVTANVNCNGNSTGSAQSAPSGGSAPYTYHWSTSATTTSISTLSAGTYTLQVTDKNGCTATGSVTITQPATPLSTNATITSNVACNGNSTGSVQSVPSGGTPAYTYAWSTGATTSGISSLSAGTYTLTVHDNHGCTATGSVTITQPAASLSANASVTANVNCNGNNNGNAQSAPSGGTNPYTYHWSTLAITSTISALSAGTYTLSVTDNHGCTTTGSVTITQPATALSANATVTSNVACNGNSTGSAQSAPSGGTPAYTYTWSTGATTSSISGLSAGTYTLTVSDNHGCTTTGSVTITQPAIALLANASVAANIACNGNSTGSAQSVPSGGTNPYTYHWSTAATTTSINTLSAGTYTLLVTDKNGCTATGSVTITQPLSLSSNATVTGNVACNGNSTGSAQSAPSGGTNPYTYHWSTSATTSSISTLSAGTYTLLVTDKNGCSATGSVTITQPATGVSANATITANVNCKGNSTGSAQSAPSGGSSPYTYHWSTLATTTSISALSAGTYTLLVTDKNGCTATGSVTITQPASALTVIISSETNAPCNAGNGSAAASGSGGTGTITYVWNDANTTSGPTLSAVAGNYTVTATDANGCTATVATTIGQPGVLRDSLVGSVNLTCYNINIGSITLGAKGGTTPYTYSWIPNVSSSSSASGLSAGTYTISLTDAKGCSATAIQVTLTEPVRLIYVSAGVVSYVTCFGLSNGKATGTPVGGSLPYTYSWVNSSNTVVATIQTPANLTAGSYTITVKDNCGASVSASVTITQPNQLGSTISSITNVGCTGGTGGKATASVTGGTFPYSYLWNPGGSTLATATGLSAGTYTVIATDAHGCSTTANAVATITQPAPIRDSVASSTSLICNGGRGSMTIGVKGGSSPYTYTWNPAVSTTSTATNISSRTYTVTIKDVHGCSATLACTLTQPIAIHDTIVSSLKVNVSCNGGNTGSATVGVKYGLAPYTYAWTNGQTNATATGLSAGTYSVTITDHNGCSSSACPLTITQPALLRDSISATSCSNSLITATVGVKGGVSPYTYSWSPGGGTKATMTGLAAGTYTITVKDAKGCSNTITPNLICVPSALNAKEQAPGLNNACCGELDNISLYPNPNTGQFTLTGLQTAMTVEIYDYTGRKISSQLSTNNSQLTINISDQANGIYLIRILDNAGNLVSQKKVVKTQ